MSEVIKNRYEFTVLFDVENGNPNGDPDAENMPRIDHETGFGIITDICLKRKIRNYVEAVKDDALNFKIYVKDGTPLDENRKWAYTSCEVEPPKTDKGAVSTDEPKDKEEFKKVNKFMCDNFYDIRTFGAVMTLKFNCGQVRGPVQFGFAKSIDIIAPQELTITSVTYANEGEKRSKMGRKHIIPYALYRMNGYVSANLARKSTGFSEEDLALLWEAIANMFEHDHSAARGNMAVRGLYLFKHQSELGNCPAHKLFDTIHVKRNTDAPARSFSDYTVTVSTDAIPESVELIQAI